MLSADHVIPLEDAQLVVCLRSQLQLDAQLVSPEYELIRNVSVVVIEVTASLLTLAYLGNC